ncbi:dihydroneopterin triphosphate 2'-epimerase [Pleionea sediminis]|uniref:dihydroneopterin triphosphate 2'-epimerase n=1 Tax=Pleionea sediminis TaxID=2569479 RepID=UPI00118482A7|nr:dihydroneopterin triphosphate 2'-epimerase [Pleionea sediminis]
MSVIKPIKEATADYQLENAKIHVQNLRLRTLIGFNPEELTKPQDVVINASIEFDAAQASMSDNEKDTLDYKVITKQMIEHVENNQFRLLEKLTADLVAIVMSHPKVSATQITVDKPHALRFSDSVSVTLNASR